MPPWPRPATGIKHSGCAYIRPSVAQVKIFVQGRISGTIDDRKLKKRLLTYNAENNVSGLFTFEWFALIAKKTTFDLGTLDSHSGERSCPLGYLFSLIWISFKAFSVFLFFQDFLKFYFNWNLLHGCTVTIWCNNIIQGYWSLILHFVYH